MYKNFTEIDKKRKERREEGGRWACLEIRSWRDSSPSSACSWTWTWRRTPPGRRSACRRGSFCARGRRRRSPPRAWVDRRTRRAAPWAGPWIWRRPVCNGRGARRGDRARPWRAPPTAAGWWGAPSPWGRAPSRARQSPDRRWTDSAPHRPSRTWGERAAGCVATWRLSSGRARWVRWGPRACTSAWSRPLFARDSAPARAS